MIGLSQEEIQHALDRLLARTSDGRATWTPSGPQNFLTTTPKFGFSILSRDVDDRAPYVFEIYRLGSKAAESETIKVAMEMTSQQNPLNDKLATLYRAAKLASLGMVDLGSELFKDLE